MARYIDVDKAIGSINRILIEKENDKSSTAYFAFEKFKELLETAPTADVVPTSELDRVMREKTTLECIVGTARNIARADTVKKMKERLRFEIINKPSEFRADQGTVDFLNGSAHKQLEVLEIVDQIAKEILEGTQND